MVQTKEKRNRTEIILWFLFSFKSEDKFMESKLFTLKLKAGIEKWDLNLSSDIFVNDIKNLLKIWRCMTAN
jgi:hypothetical protein